MPLTLIRDIILPYKDTTETPTSPLTHSLRYQHPHKHTHQGHPPTHLPNTHPHTHQNTHPHTFTRTTTHILTRRQPPTYSPNTHPHTHQDTHPHTHQGHHEDEDPGINIEVLSSPFDDKDEPCHNGWVENGLQDELLDCVLDKEPSSL